MGQAQSDTGNRHVTTEQLSSKLVSSPDIPLTNIILIVVLPGKEIRETLLHVPRIILLPRCLPKPR